ncbi:hypothetical protein ABZ312_09860 [Streptomyces sp. NPDC006207]
MTTNPLGGVASALAVIVKHGEMSDTVRRELGDLLADIQAAEDTAPQPAEVDGPRARIAELERATAQARADLADSHDDLAHALGQGNGAEWADLIALAAHAPRAQRFEEEARQLRARVAELEAAQGAADNCRCFDAPGHDAACHKSKVLHEGVAYSAVHWHLDSGQDWWMPYGIDEDGQLTFLADGDPWATPKPLAELIARYGPITGTEYGVEIARHDLPRTEP